MTWDHFGIYKEGAQSPRELHILNVYKDPDFSADIELLYPPNLSINIEAIGVVESKGNVELPNHETFLKVLRHVTLEQQQLMKAQLNAVSDSKVKAMAHKYAIKEEDVLFYLYGNATFDRFHRDSYQPYSLQSQDDFNYTIKLNLDITKEDFMQIWKLIARYKNERYKGKITKTKLPVYDRLLYAIFKQRQKTPPTPFPKIHQMYLNDTLPGYKHEQEDDDRIYDAKKLEEYYNKYKPIPPI